MEKALKTLTETYISTVGQPEEVVIHKLFGQASSRQYFRVSWSNPLPLVLDRPLVTSLIVMKMPNGFSSPAEEVTKLEEGAPQEFSFLNVHTYLDSCGVLVPKVFKRLDDDGVLLLEDLGDKTFENLVIEAPEEIFLLYYKKAIDGLINLQVKTSENPSKQCMAYYRRFSEELLNWEFYHFLEYGIEDRFEKTLSDSEKEKFNTITGKISAYITKQPQGLTHRDFQSRNIMFHNFNFYLIDFQDALVGPVIYDLVALLRDSYIEITPTQLNTLIEYYANNLPESHPYFGQHDHIKKDFHLVSLQRKLKDTGRFQYIKTVRGNPSFLPHVPLSLQYVKNTFNELNSCLKDGSPISIDDLTELRSLISKYVEELK